MNKTTRLKWLTLLCAIFIIGGALGFLSGQTYQKYRFQQFHRARPNPRSNFNEFLSREKNRTLENLKKELHPTEDQVKKISDILEKQLELTQEEFKSSREKLKSVREEVVKEIELVLTAEQKGKYAEYRAKRERERKRRWTQDTTFISTETTIKKEK